MLYDDADMVSLFGLAVSMRALHPIIWYGALVTKREEVSRS